MVAPDLDAETQAKVLRQVRCLHSGKGMRFDAMDGRYGMDLNSIPWKTRPCEPLTARVWAILLDVIGMHVSLELPHCLLFSALKRVGSIPALPGS